MKMFNFIRVAAFLSPFILWSIDLISATWCWAIFLSLCLFNGLYYIITVDEDGQIPKQQERQIFTWTVKETGKIFSGYILDTNYTKFVVDNETKQYYNMDEVNQGIPDFSNLVKEG